MHCKFNEVKVIKYICLNIFIMSFCGNLGFKGPPIPQQRLSVLRFHIE